MTRRPPAGIMANDIITHLDEVPVQGLTLNQAVEKMRGPETIRGDRKQP
jgi:C-terminal processing protease CtpA/Prc